MMCVINKQHWLKNLEVMKVKSVTVQTPEPYYVQLDGDRVEKNNYFDVQVLPQALRVIVPAEKLLT